jgi:hypothetical protein
MLKLDMKYLLPVCLLLPALLFISCTTKDIDLPNQKQAFASPSRRYILNVPIEWDAQDQLHYWRVTISDAKGTVLFKDDSPFQGRFNVYWYWDNNDRVWLKNSDNGNTYYWEIENGKWQRTQWHEDNTKSLLPPPELFTDYRRKKN